MIKAKIAREPKILIVFDMPQSKKWINQCAITPDGIAAFLSRFMAAGIDLPGEVSAVCLADSLGAKAADYKAKQPYIAELVETHAFNLVVPVGAKAFELVMGFKGIERYFGKTLRSDIYKCKVLPCPNPSMIKFKPEISEVLDETVKVAAKEKEFPEVIAKAKLHTNYEIIDTMEKFETLLHKLLEVPAFAFDLETTGFHHNQDEILTAQFTYEFGQSALIPSTFYKKSDGTNMFWTDEQWAEITRRLRTVFMRQDVLVIGHNIKFDLKFIYHWWKVPVPKSKFLVDTMIMSFLVDENTANDLKTLACLLTDLGDYEFPLEEWKRNYCKKNKIKVGEFSYKYVPFDTLAQYALTDTDATYRLWLILRDQVKAEEQWDVFKMLMRFTYTTCHMELTGWPVDLEYAATYLQELDRKIADAEADLLAEPIVKKAERILSVLELQKVNSKRKNKLTGLPEPFTFNLRSNDQKRVLFFQVMGLPPVKMTKTKDADGKRTTPSMDKEVIEKWSFDLPKVAPFLEKIKTHAELCKMRSTYVVGIMNKAVKQHDGTYRIHPTYNVIGAKTGRLSSRNPNWQNLPVRNAEAKNVKRIVKASTDWLLLGADLSAAEMRYACICSSDKKLEAIFNSGVDIHGAIAKEVFHLDCSPNEVKTKYPELRDIAKTIQFLTLYGGGAETLASKVKIKPKRAKAILEQLMREADLAKCVGSKIDAEGKEVKLYEYDYTLLKGSARAVHLLSDMFKFPEWKAAAVLDARDKPGALMSAFEIDRDEAQAILNSYFDGYPGVQAYIESTKCFVARHGYSLSLLGRKRRVSEVYSDDDGVKERGIRQAVNATIQSVASDGLMLSVCDLQEYIEEQRIDWIKVLGVIHDAAYCEVKRDKLTDGRDLLLSFLINYPSSINPPIPMVADAEYGEDWAHFSEAFEEFAALHQEFEEEDEEEEAA